MVYRGRFAPSPTGPLHFGSLIAAMASYADARAHHGAWLVRLEDLDPPREQLGAADAILRTLAHYGFEWDVEVVYQSARAARYEEGLQRLLEHGLLFACRCARRDLAQAPLGASGERVYPGTCRDKELVATADSALRVAVPDIEVDFTDLLQGPQRQSLARAVGDFVVKRADGLYAYQLAVVIDDAAQGITHIVRGSDLLTSTPRQIWLQRVLGFATPEYLHIPVAINKHGEKLSKQTRARSLPADPMPALRAAWRFLDQVDVPREIATPHAFWQWAARAWSRPRLPPVTMLPEGRGAA